MPRIRLALLIAVFIAPAPAASQVCTSRLMPFHDAGALWRRRAELTRDSIAGEATGPQSPFRTTLQCRDERLTVSRDAGMAIEWPDLRVTMAGGVPDSREDGALWSGRGLSARIRGGVRMDIGPLHAVLAPELWYTTNRPFDLLRGGDTTRSTFSSPYYVGLNSLDLPSRMGMDPVTEFNPGQSGVWGEWRALEFGWASSNVWWGPGQREGLVFGPGAAGIPRLFLRSPRPIHTRYGRLTFDWFLGALSESRWFDDESSNDLRSMSAAGVSWSPRHTDNLAIGFARAVQRVVPSNGELLSHAFDAVREAPSSDADRMTSAFFRLAIPQSGMRVWAELATPRPLGRIRDLLAMPGLDLAYQLGAEQSFGSKSTGWLLHVEVVSLEPGRMALDAPARAFYAGSGTPHGWTHRGQLLGGDTGPGSNSQWFSVDRLARRWTLGGYLERVRWNNDILPTVYLPTIFRHDVTVRLGVRAAMHVNVRGIPYDVAVDASIGNRLNYLFQNTTWIEAYRTVDVAVPQLRLTFSPRR